MQKRPVIPDSEYPLRWKKVRSLMERMDLDIVVAYSDDHAVFGPAHARWLAGFPAHFEPACVIIGRSGKPVLLCGPESDEYALLAGKIPDVRVLAEFSHPDEDYPYFKIHGLSEIAAEAVGGLENVRRIGLAGGALMSASVLNAFKKAIPGAVWLDVETEMCSIRAVKSHAEIEVIRYAYKIAEKGIAAAVGVVRPGVSERDVAAEAEYAMRSAGSEGMGIDTIVASGPNTRPILARTTTRKIGKNDLVLLTLAPRYEGYHSAIGRPVVVGKVKPEIGRAVKTAIAAQKACFDLIRPGAEGRAVEAAGRRVVGDAGFGNYFLYSGLHSVGVVEFEPPIFGPSSPAKLEKNMVVSVDIPMFNTPWGGIRVEDGFLVTATGAERLNKTEFEIKK
jgi:Xaa-Pro aminopeptidase